MSQYIITTDQGKFRVTTDDGNVATAQPQKPQKRFSILNNPITNIAVQATQPILNPQNVGKLFQSVPTTLTGKSMEQRANELASSPKIGQSNTRPFDKNLGMVRPIAGALNIGGQIADIATTPASYIPVDRILAPIGKKLIPGLMKGSEVSYTQALGATTQKEKELAQRVVPQLVQRKPIFRTRGNLLETADKNVEKYGINIDKEFSNIPKETRINLEPIFKNINDAQESLKINGEIPQINQARFTQLEKTKLDFINTMKSIEPSPTFVREYRQALDGAIEESKQGFKMTGRGGAKLKAQRIMANSIRNELAQKFPNIAKLNKEYNLWANLQDLLESTVPKTKSPLSAMHAFGAFHQGNPWIGMFVNLGKLVSDNVLWNSVAGSAKSKLADMIAKGEFNNANKLITSLKIMGVAKNQQTGPYKDIRPSLQQQPFKNIKERVNAETTQ